MAVQPKNSKKEGKTYYQVHMTLLFTQPSLMRLLMIPIYPADILFNQEP